MPSYAFGLILSILVVVAPIFLTKGDKMIFISGEAILVVLCGTVCVSLIAYPFKQVKFLMKVVLVVARKEVDTGQAVAEELIKLARDTRGERSGLKMMLDNIKDPFIKEGVALITDKMDEDLETLLLDRIRTIKEEHESNVAMLRKLSQFPPALGLLATVLSLIFLLQGMGGGNVGIGNLGPTMAVGLVGTLYGIVVSNFVFNPMAENVAYKSHLDIRNRQIVMVGLMALSQKKPALVVQEMVNSMLPVHRRIDPLGINGGAKS